MKVGGLSATSGAILFSTDATTLAQSANFLYTETSGPRLQVGTSGANSGIIAGYYGVSGFGALWFSGLTPSTTNYALAVSAGDIYLNGVATTNTIFFQTGNSQRGFIGGAAGQGLAITAGTATTDVAALSITRTNNNAAVLRGVEFLFTDTTSGAFTPLWIKGGAAAATSLLKLSKAGLLDCPSYAVGGAAGASFGPGLPTSITVVNGIITAIS